jgi:hypothetical protein
VWVNLDGINQASQDVVVGGKRVIAEEDDLPDGLQDLDFIGRPVGVAVETVEIEEGVWHGCGMGFNRWN